MNNPLMNFAMKMLHNNPNIASNPRNQELMNALQSGDEAKCKKIAENLCQSYGMSPEDAIKQARQFFGM